MLQSSPKNSNERRTRAFGMLAVSLLFTLLISIVARRSHDYDLQPSYVGCRVLAAGEGPHLYSHSTVAFNRLYDTTWDALNGGTAEGGHYIGPTYVQTPLWAWLIRPACTTMGWNAFRYTFMAIILFSICGIVVLTLRFWAPAFYSPLWLAVILFAVEIGKPFKAVLAAGQTHAIFMAATLLAIILAEKGYGKTAGGLLACAAAVKITPGFLLLYWLVTRKWSAAASFVITSVALVLLTIATTGLSLFHTFVTNLVYTSNILLISYNNQSLAAWWEGMHMAPELKQWLIHPLPPGIKAVSMLLTLASVIGGGLLDRRREGEEPPYGALFALLGATVFASIAWNHYAFFLIVPILLLLQRYTTDRRWLWLALALGVYLLNLAAGLGIGTHLLVKITRSHFFAMLLAMVAMALCAVLSRSVNGVRTRAARSAPALT